MYVSHTYGGSKVMCVGYFIKILKRKKFVIFAVLITVFIIFMNTDLSPDLYFIHWNPLEDISCHYSYIDDALPLIEKDTNLPSKSIFFHETSCRGNLNSRQACAVESAARTHPNWQVNVLFAGPVPKENLNSGSLEALQQFTNVKVFRLHLVEYAKGTPLEDMVSEGALNRTRWRISHTSDALRYLSLYKWGGVYLDLDHVVAKSFDELANNWAARESANIVAAGALAFSSDHQGRFMADVAIRNFKAEYRGDAWGHNGPGVITRVLKSMCDVGHLSEMSASTCGGFEVYGPEMFYPVPWQKASLYFETEDLKLGDPYTYHVWNRHSAVYGVNNKSFYAKLAQKYCPTIHTLYGDQFGT